jgi:hypothetical protein
MRSLSLIPCIVLLFASTSSLAQVDGYFITDKVDVGGEIGFTYSDWDDSRSHGYNIGPRFNYHFLPRRPIVPFVGLSGGWRRRESEYESGFTWAKNTSDGWYLRARGGADFFVTKSVAIKLSLGYYRSEMDYEYRDAYQPMTVSMSKAVFEYWETRVGFGLFFDWHKKT